VQISTQGGKIIKIVGVKMAHEQALGLKHMYQMTTRFPYCCLDYS
jgi:hypothetical protein